MICDKTAAEMWTAIEADASTRSPLFVIDTKRRLTEMRSIGGMFNDAEYITLLMTSLPNSYSSLLNSVSAATTVTSTALKADNLLKVILEDVHKREVKERNSKTAQVQKAGEAALWAKSARTAAARIT